MVTHSNLSETQSPQNSDALFSPRAFLAGIGTKLRQLQLFGPIAESVKIAQKTLKHSPIQKLYDAFISLLCGAKGLVEINKLLRSDPGLQQAFGRESCAEQSVVQQTLDASTPENVEQMHQAMDKIYRQHSQGYQHDYTHQLQILDVDMSGQPCGVKAAFATKGYFAKQRNRRGRQLGRVLATRYHEVVVDRLFGGKIQLTNALQPLVSAAEATLELSQGRTKRQRTLIRVDGGGGSLKQVNGLLKRGYKVLAKDYSSQRASRLAKSVERWVDDPHNQGRQVGWVTEAPSEYVRAVRRIAVRCRKNNGKWGYGVLICNLSAEQVQSLPGVGLKQVDEADAQLLSYVYSYDQRGGGVETSFKNDRQGLGMSKRNKKRFEAQQMLVQLGALAHNVTIWSRGWLREDAPKLRRYGVLRMVRDVFTTSGLLVFDGAGAIIEIILNQADTLAKSLIGGLSALLAPVNIAVNLGKT